MSLDTNKSRSNLEAQVASYLQENKIDFKQNYPYPGCKRLGQLYYDFYFLISRNTKEDEQKVNIEIDGPHHFSDKILYNLDKSGKGTNLTTIRACDYSKTIFNIKENIHSFRISYGYCSKLKKALELIVVLMRHYETQQPLVWYFGVEYTKHLDSIGANCCILSEELMLDDILDQCKSGLYPVILV